ncbi:MAG: ATPase [Candidatus Entotheonella factor]|uniref:ATPase n=1 Tax=Entotheonella factor TaxID=1429438 RepID=W4L9W5_ENTF1|nr:MAG: ATPase [Candidatus Entotheonella factor]
MTVDQLDSIEAVETAMRAHDYICDRSLATVIFLSLKLNKPILFEGEAGVGKTEVAKVLADLLRAKLIRLQCYEGLDVSTALYEWNFPKQMLHIKIAEATEDARREQLEREIFSPDYLIQRPLLEAIQGAEHERVVLLIDEIDRSDEEFEAFLLEILSDFQISIPEIGTLRAVRPPVVILTSNRTRDIHDALKRRCLFHWIDYPTFAKEYEIVRTKVPGLHDDLAKQICQFVESMREQDFFKRPGVAETLDWSRALLYLGRSRLDIPTVNETLGCILKYKEDLDKADTDLFEVILNTIRQS